MRILLTSYFFYPENTPRAFRTTELAKEFVRLGHEVVVVIPEYPFDHERYAKENRLEILQTSSGFVRNRKVKFRTADPSSVLTGIPVRDPVWKKIFRGLYRQIYFNGDSAEYTLPLARRLGSMRRSFDLLISVGLPASVHLGTALGLAFNRSLAARTVADYGDPFSENKGIDVRPLHRSLERWWLRYFDRVTVPIPSAAGAFKGLKDERFIHIIPQGFSLESLVLPVYHRHDIPQFAYAGLFYEKIRNPRLLFEHLATLSRPFVFTVYTDLGHSESVRCIAPFTERLGNKLIVRHLLPREECLKELAQFDFLVNIHNSTSEQMPTKLVDYAIAQRPIFHCSQNELNASQFDAFCSRDYSSERLPRVDLDAYDIRTVAQQFLSLV